MAGSFRTLQLCFLSSAHILLFVKVPKRHPPPWDTARQCWGPPVPPLLWAWADIQHVRCMWWRSQKKGVTQHSTPRVLPWKTSSALKKYNLQRFSSASQHQLPDNFLSVLWFFLFIEKVEKGELHKIPLRFYCGKEHILPVLISDLFMFSLFLF